MRALLRSTLITKITSRKFQFKKWNMLLRMEKITMVKHAIAITVETYDRKQRIVLDYLIKPVFRIIL